MKYCVAATDICHSEMLVGKCSAEACTQTISGSFRRDNEPIVGADPQHAYRLIVRKGTGQCRHFDSELTRYSGPKPFICRVSAYLENGEILTPTRDQFLNLCRGESRQRVSSGRRIAFQKLRHIDACLPDRRTPERRVWQSKLPRPAWKSAHVGPSARHRP